MLCSRSAQRGALTSFAPAPGFVLAPLGRVDHAVDTSWTIREGCLVGQHVEREPAEERIVRDSPASKAVADGLRDSLTHSNTDVRGIGAGHTSRVRRLSQLSIHNFWLYL